MPITEKEIVETTIDADSQSEVIDKFKQWITGLSYDCHFRLGIHGIIGGEDMEAIQTKQEMCMPQVEPPQEIQKNMSFSQRLLFLLGLERKRPAPLSEPLLLLEFRPSVSLEEAAAHANDCIRLWQMLGHKVIVRELLHQIPNEYIGIASCWNEGILKFQEYLNLRVEYVEIKKLEYERIPPSAAFVLS